jgi:hypothetical protein
LVSSSHPPTTLIDGDLFWSFTVKHALEKETETQNDTDNSTEIIAKRKEARHKRFCTIMLSMLAAAVILFVYFQDEKKKKKKLMQNRFHLQKEDMK